MNFEGAYLSDGWVDSPQVCNRRCSTLSGVSAVKMVQFRPVIFELRMHENGIFLVPVKYILVFHAPVLAVLSCMTHYHAS